MLLGVGDGGWRRQTQLGEDVCLLWGGLGGDGECGVAGGVGGVVEALHGLSGVGPGLTGGVFDDAGQEQGEPAEADVGADTVFEAVPDGSEVQSGFHVTPPPFDLEELFIAECDVGGAHVGIGTAEQVFPVQAGFVDDLRLVDTQ